MSQSATMLCDNSGDSADNNGLGCGDLGIPYYRAHDNTWGYVFGDSFSGQNQTGTWMSPVILDQATFDSSGSTAIAFTYAEPNPPAAQCFNYTHNADNGFGFEVTRIPNDAIEYNGRTFIQYTSVNSWPTGATSHDCSLYAGVGYSDDYGDTWSDFSYHFAGDAQGNNGSLYGMWTFAGIDTTAGKIYIFSKAWNGNHSFTGDNAQIILWRMSLTDFYNGSFGTRENWHNTSGTWSWSSTLAASPIFASGNDLGEFSVKKIGSTWVMSYLDCSDGSIKTRTASAVTGPWSSEKIQVVGSNIWPPAHWGKPQQNNLYGGYIHPGSASTSNLCLIISSWDGVVGDYPYTATQWTGLSA